MIRNYQTTRLPSLSERETLMLEGLPLEADLTSGGAADLPDVFADITRELDYKTLRYPGHYAWVEEQIRLLSPGEKLANQLDTHLQKAIPQVEDDVVYVYASVEGKNKQGRLVRIDKALKVEPMEVGGKRLRAIQSTTASALAECARMLLKGGHKGVILQSQIDPAAFLNGLFVKAAYGSLG